MPPGEFRVGIAPRNRQVARCVEDRQVGVLGARELDRLDRRNRVDRRGRAPPSARAAARHRVRGRRRRHARRTRARRDRRREGRQQQGGRRMSAMAELLRRLLDCSYAEREGPSSGLLDATDRLDRHQLSRIVESGLRTVMITSTTFMPVRGNSQRGLNFGVPSFEVCSITTTTRFTPASCLMLVIPPR